MYMLNWLSARPAWMNRVDIWSPQKSPSPQMWRDFLNGTDTERLPSGTQSASTKLAVQVILGDIIQAAHDDPVRLFFILILRRRRLRAFQTHPFISHVPFYGNSMNSTSAMNFTHSIRPLSRSFGPIA
ncbi:hypothetical protein M404DRAFT_31149 [Pisolithus tinctorius Marx 270]|uniref:Uncharacterized protein n=1 Tax=Pisolithus tinctorius Marx 270 TaxID=870435 RepID=A0A0C3INV3_PISTI|nr:hypothetical protein M404DRAFT_31149 [Pisolithus tinctorius Marx 270]